MRTTIAIIICLLLFITGMVAQERKPEPWDVQAEKKYKKRQEEVKEEVWNIKQAGFRNRTVPPEYAKESAVILARYVDLMTPQKAVKLHRTERNLVAINDKAALERYSDFEFKQYENYDDSYQLEPFDKITKVVYLGVRIYKKDGSTKEIYGDEAVVTDLVRNRYKSRKLAIPGLQVGDLVDYYFREESFVIGANNFSRELFVFGEEEPVLEYAIHIGAFNEWFSMEYRSMNGAPNFKERYDDHLIHLDMLVRNIPPQPVNLWMNPFRQLPMVRVHLRPGARNEKAGRRKEGMIYANPNATKIRDEAVMNIAPLRNMKAVTTLPSYDEVNDRVKRFKKENPNASQAQLAEFIYHVVRFVVVYHIWPNDPIVVDRRRNFNALREANFLLYVNYVLDKYDVPAEFVFTTVKDGPALADVFDSDDFRMMLRTTGDKPVFMSVDGLFATTDHIPADFEGQKGALLPRNSTHIDGQWDIPESSAGQNRQTNLMKIGFAKDNLQQLEIDRETTVTGHFRKRTQQQLLLFEDYYAEERKLLGIETSFMDDFKKSRNTRALHDEYLNAFDRARRAVKDYFREEVQQQFEDAIPTLDTFGIKAMGLRTENPDLVYNTRFSLDGLVKKAGADYILDAGRLIGGQVAVKPSQRKRTADIYMSFARSFAYDIEFDVPEGYVAEGIEKLPRQVDNECGSFIVKAEQKDGKLRLQITKTYKMAHAAAAKWPQLLEMIDAAEAFKDQKILFRKAG
ncbi:hypothetical protein ACQKLP_02890 [Chitinophaga sp. NPDC101104]|uniref:hypothetical protein n=1 Tax=Chitinophaga sp. NPDC101104 TaxID=3390561 RepID=UPI003D02AA88